MKQSLRSTLGLGFVLCVGLACGWTSETTSVANVAAPTEADVKQFITRKEEALATDVGSAHKSVTLTFESIRFGTPRKANAGDRVDKLITGSTVYPARVKYTSHRTWGNGDTEDKKIHYAYEFYQDEYKEWNAYLAGPVN